MTPLPLTLTTSVVELRTQGRGLYEITEELQRAVRDAAAEEGLCVAHLQHTSASLLVQENADPSVRRDLERFFERLAPEGDALYTHTLEGPDDMPAHIRSALTQTTLTLPIVQGALALGRWQGVYLWEHRRSPHMRRLIVQTPARPVGDTAASTPPAAL